MLKYCHNDIDLQPYYEYFGLYRKLKEANYLDNQYTNTYYLKRNFYKIEIDYINDYLNSKKYMILDFEIIESQKNVLIKLLDETDYKNKFVFLKLPKLVYITQQSHSIGGNKNIYFWRKPDGKIVMRESWHNLYEHGNRNIVYKPGYINRYGWKLEFIDNIKIFQYDENRRVRVGAYLDINGLY